MVVGILACQLDRLHPSLVPPADGLLDDLSNDLHDSVYQKGLLVADEIRSETSLQGRMRRPLLARIQEQQQQRGLSRVTDRARTIRPLGGGVIRSATTSTTTATAPTTNTTTTTTTMTTCATTTTAAAVAAAVDEEKKTKRKQTVSRCTERVPSSGPSDAGSNRSRSRSAFSSFRK